MQAADVPRAVMAATEVATRLGLSVADAIVLNDSNKLTLRLLPCDVVARVAVAGQEHFEMELQIAQQLGERAAPVARPADPRVHRRDGFAITLWSYYEQVGSGVSPAGYVAALEQLHAAMANLDVAAPHFTERVAEARNLVAAPGRSPELDDVDRALLIAALEGAPQSSREQLLHGEPHPGNLLGTPRGPVFVDLETCCRGPVEFDLAHVPEAVAARYPDVDPEVLRTCRGLVLAMVCAWRWDRDDRLPNGRRAGQALLRVLRAGPPWPVLDDVVPAPTPSPR